jgi:[protein-PII] uridylyltransferase
MNRKITKGNKPQHGFLKHPLWLHIQEIKAHLAKEISRPGFRADIFSRDYTSSMDALIAEIADSYSLRLGTSRKGLVLIAIGGYGRGEMAPYSDVDIMVLSHKHSRGEIETFIQEFMYPLWDLGVEIGYSVRTLDECGALSRKDLTIYTALVDSRYLWGDGVLFNRYRDEVLTKILRRNPEKTLFNLRTSTKKRHEHYGRSIFLLEPNVKEGKGGIRDYHVIRWALWAFDGILDISQWTERDIISITSEHDLKLSLDFLWKARLCLHLVSGRKNERLTFQFQEEIARILGYRQMGHTLDVEVFMRDYYEKAAIINRTMSLVFEKLSWRRRRHRVFKRLPESKRVSRHFILKQGKVEATTRSVFESDPVEMVRAFYFASLYGTEVGWKTKEYITDVLATTQVVLAEDTAALEAFLDIFRKGKNIASILLQMNQVRLLEHLIPEFRNIYCRVQHDVYHIYTVDVHSIFTVAEMEKLWDVREMAPDFLLSKLAREIENPYILYLAGFFHDIGKGGGKNHAVLGAVMVNGIARHFGLSKSEKDLLVFLVRHHLLISETAQRRDLFEEKLIVSMAHIIGSVEALKMLYILTYADIRAVGPEAWNEWKGHLLREFFFKVLHVLEKGEDGTKVAAVRIKRRLRQLSNWIKKGDMPQKAYLELLDTLPHRYLMQTPLDIIKGHLQLLYRHLDEPVVCDIKEDPLRGISEVIVIADDQHGLFSSIAGVMTANKINILNAEIHTTTHHVAMDIFHVNSPFEPNLIRSGIWENFRRDLRGVLGGEKDLAVLVARNRVASPRRRKGRKALPPDVRVDNEASDFYTIIDVFADDRVGLLYDITRTLSSLGLDISLAKISTKVDRAADVFYVKNESGEKIYDEEKIKRVCETLKAASMEAWG